MEIKTGGMGWIPDLPDNRDKVLASVRLEVARALPPKIDYRAFVVEIYDQSSIGACVGHGCSALFEFVDNKQGGSNMKPSRLAAYYWARKYQGWEGIDSGAMIRDGIKAFVDYGAAPADLWPYDIAKFTLDPPLAAYNAAKLRQAIQYLRVDQNNGALKACIADGYPFVFGSTLYENFMSIGHDGMVPMPNGKVIGGHCMLVVGYDDAIRCYICQNSWGVGFGDHGFIYIPYAYIEDPNLTGDIWTIRQVEEVDAPQPTPPQPTPPQPGPPKPDPVPPQPIPPKPDPAPPQPEPKKLYFDGILEKVKMGGKVLITRDIGPNIDVKSLVGKRVRTTEL